MFSLYPAVRKVDKPDDEELIAVVSALISRVNELYQITNELKNEPKPDPKTEPKDEPEEEEDESEVPVQLISPLAINKTNVPDYLRMIAYLTGITRKELMIIENRQETE